VAYFFRATLYSLMCAFAINDDGADTLFFAPPPAFKILDPPLSTPPLIRKRAPYWSNVNLKRRRSRNCSTHRTSLRLNNVKIHVCNFKSPKRWTKFRCTCTFACKRRSTIALNTLLRPLVSDLLFIVYLFPAVLLYANKAYRLNSHNWIARPSAQLSKRASKFENRLVETTASADLILILLKLLLTLWIGLYYLIS